MGEEISTRLATLRKHLGERLGEKLTMEMVAERSGLTEQQVYRLEHGLNGTTNSLLGLMQFYGSHGYNLNWLVFATNHLIPMILSPGTELQQISEIIQQISQSLEQGRSKLNVQLKELGYFSLDEAHDSPVESDMPEAVGLAL